MSITERNERAFAYIEKCRRRRERDARRRKRNIDRFLEAVFPWRRAKAPICG